MEIHRGVQDVLRAERRRLFEWLVDWTGEIELLDSALEFIPLNHHSARKETQKAKQTRGELLAISGHSTSGKWKGVKSVDSLCLGEE